MAENHFIVPTHPGEDIGPYVPVTTPEQAWPVTGLFDYPFGTSVRIGVNDLERAMAKFGNDDLIIFGHSQSSVISYIEKRKLAAQYPIGTPAPDINFVTIGTLNLPNGGVMTRFWGAYLPLVDFYFNGPAPTNTQFHTDIITQRWDGFADFPMFPINLLAVANAVAGFFYTHEDYEAVTLAGDPSKYFVGTHGDTDYYFFPTKNLPLFGPLRQLGVPESLIDIVEPITIFLVELGYRRDIPPWVATPAQLIPLHNPFTVIGDFFEAVEETIQNTAALIGAAPAVTPAPVAAPSAATRSAPVDEAESTLTEEIIASSTETDQLKPTDIAPIPVADDREPTERSVSRKAEMPDEKNDRDEKDDGSGLQPPRTEGDEQADSPGPNPTESETSKSTTTAPTKAQDSAESASTTSASQAATAA
jgi:hypothetical protein